MVTHRDGRSSSDQSGLSSQGRFGRALRCSPKTSFSGINSIVAAPVIEAGSSSATSIGSDQRKLTNYRSLETSIESWIVWNKN
jgi:hypothetical protein